MRTTLHLIAVCISCISLSSISLFASSVAQNSHESSQVSELSPAVHVGSKSGCPLGSQEFPVTANEYCAFLNTHANDDTMNLWYYDSMLFDNYGSESDQMCLHRSGSNHQYHYSVKKGCGNFIIDATQAEYAQKSFNEWRKNPTAIELCNYLNNKVEDLITNDEANKLGLFGGLPIEMPNCYSHSAFDIRSRYLDAQEIFVTMDRIAQEIHDGIVLVESQTINEEGNAITTTTPKKCDYQAASIDDEANRTLISFSNEIHTSFLSGMLLHAIIALEGKYYRASSITIHGVTYSVPVEVSPPSEAI